MEDLKKCPVCSELSLIPGETVDVGFGSHMGVKCGPDHCENCGYIEQGPDPTDKPIEYYRQCWANGVDPHPAPPKMIHAPLKQEYQNWINQNVRGNGYGDCKEYSRRMASHFPELRRVYGKYYCVSWGERHHFWCITAQNEIVDPTAQQFPSNGHGIYCFDREYPIDIKDKETAQLINT